MIIFRNIKKVLITINYYSEKNWNRLLAALEPAEIVLAKHDDFDAVKSAIRDVDVAIMGGDIRCDTLAEAKNIQWIHCDHAGLNNSAHPEIFERDILLSSSAGRSAPVLAEHALFFMLALTYKSRLLETQQREHTWNNPYKGQFGICGKTVGIIGFGNTGREIAKPLQGFGVKVLVYTRSSIEKPDGIEKMYCKNQGESIDELIAASDYLILAAPLTNETYHMINAERFNQMKKTAYIINMGRGALIDEKALFAALKNNDIAGAGCDVFESEPLPSESPLWDLPNMMITSHATPPLPDRDAKSLDIICENITRFQEGKPLLNALAKQDIFSRKEK